MGYVLAMFQIKKLRERAGEEGWSLLFRIFLSFLNISNIKNHQDPNFSVFATSNLKQLMRKCFKDTHLWVV